MQAGDRVVIDVGDVLQLAVLELTQEVAGALLDRLTDLLVERVAGQIDLGADRM